MVTKKQSVRQWSNFHLKRDSKCANCGIGQIPCKCGENGAKICSHKLVFHHLRYEKRADVVITLCTKCHGAMHRQASRVIKFKCKHCGKEFLDLKHNKREYCSRRCFALKRKDQITYNCEKCGKKMSIGKAHYNYVQHHFCSIKCSSSVIRKLSMIERVKVRCEYCHKIFLKRKTLLKFGKHHFCNWKCKNSTTLWRPKHGKTIKCENCGKTKYRCPSQLKYKSTFCSLKCMYELRRKR